MGSEGEENANGQFSRKIFPVSAYHQMSQTLSINTLTRSLREGSSLTSNHAVLPVIVLSTCLSLVLSLSAEAQGKAKGKGKPHPHRHKGGLPAAVTDEEFYDDGLPLEAKVARGNFLLSDKKKRSIDMVG